MNKEAFEQTIYRNWAEYFKCSVETLQKRGTSIFPESKFKGENFIALWYIGKHTFAQIDPFYDQALNTLIKELPANTSLSADHVQEAWNKDTIQSQDIGLVYYLFPADLQPSLPPAPFSLRKLTEADAEAMSTLHTANTPEDVDEGYVEVTHQVAFGCFLGKQLIAAASGYERTGFLDIGVLTHPEFRKKGLGKAVVGALCDWANQNKRIAQYRHNILNINSQSVAQSLNFQMYFKSEGISLR